MSDERETTIKAGRFGAWAERNFWPILAILLFALSFASHWPVRRGGFQADDYLFLSLAHWQSVLSSFVGDAGQHNVYRPIYRLSAYIDVLIFGRHPAGPHIENFAIHAASALLLAAVAHAYRLPHTLAAAIAILFLFSPLSSENVDWIAGRTGSLCLLFMLLATWRWTASLVRPRFPWAATGWMLLGAMTYEAGAALPAVLFCLSPILHKWRGVSWRLILRTTLPLAVVMAIFLVMRAAFLGSLLGYDDGTSPHLLNNLLSQLKTLKIAFLNNDSVAALWILGAALAITTFLPAFFPAGPCLFLAAVALLLPFINISNAGGRFFYMLQAPLCVVAVLPVLIVPPRVRPPMLTLLVLLLVLPVLPPTWRSAKLYAFAGRECAAVLDAVHAAIPGNDGWANIVDGVPDVYDYRPGLGWYFELATIDSYPKPPPVVIRGEDLLVNREMLKNVLGIPTRYWRYDNLTRRLEPSTRDAWLDLHPQAGASLPP